MVKMIFAAVVVALLAINVNAQTTGDCSTTKCEEGEVCIMHQVQCFTTPCPPLPTCVKKEAACSGNETWTECGTCEQACGLKLRACTKRCQPARCECVHSKGFMRDEEGRCIKKEDCPKKTISERSLRPPCPANQTWVACSSRCPATCDDKVDKKLCITACGRPKCQCSAGYVLSGEQCLLPEDCPITRETRETDEPVTAPLRPTPKCHENETLHQCGAACDSKCGQEQTFCPMICLPPACRCAEGFARNASGTCVKKVDCTAEVSPSPPTEDFVCPKGSELNPCGNHCERKCGQEWPRMCIKICGPKACVCSEGLARHADGRCVPVEQCDAAPVTPVTEQPKECPENETYSDCGTCEATCANGVPQVCPAVCKIGCTCDASLGLARNAAGECIYMEDCPGNPIGASCRTAKCAFGPCRMQVVDCDQPPCWPQPVCPQPTLTTLLPKSNTPL